MICVVLAIALLASLLSTQTAAERPLVMRNCTIRITGNPRYTISAVAENHEMTTRNADPPRNLQVISHAIGDWEMSPWINITISWDAPRDSSISGFEIEISSFYGHKNWRQNFRIVPKRIAKIATRFHYNCMAGEFASSENDENKYHVKVYSLPRRYSKGTRDPHEGVVIRVVKPLWPGEPALWGPQLIAVTNNSCDSLVRTEFTLAPQHFRFTNYAVCLKSLLGTQSCVKRLNISPENLAGSAYFILSNVTGGMYKVLIKANHREFGRDCRCKKSDQFTNRTVCVQSGCRFTASAEFRIHYRASVRCFKSNDGANFPLYRIIYVVAGCSCGMLILMCLVLIHINRRRRHIIEPNLKDMDVRLLNCSMPEAVHAIHQIASGSNIVGRHIAVLHSHDSSHHDTVVLHLTELLTRYSDSSGLVDCRQDDSPLTACQMEHLVRELSSAYAVIVVASNNAYDKAAVLADGRRDVFTAAMHTICTEPMPKTCVVSFHYTPYNRVALFDDSVPHFRIMDELDTLTSWLDPRGIAINDDNIAVLADAVNNLSDT